MEQKGGLPRSRPTCARPLLVGEWADIAVLNDGGDYYLVHSSGWYRPAILIWHSRDLHTWKPLDYAVESFDACVWVTDLAKVGGRYLFTGSGYVSRLAADRLQIERGPEKVYDGWAFPEDWAGPTRHSLSKHLSAYSAGVSEGNGSRRTAPGRPEMLQMTPEQVYATEDIRDIPDALRRTERMIAAIEPAAMEWVGLDDLDRIAADDPWAWRGRWGEVKEKRDPDVVFTTAKLLPEAEKEQMRRQYANLANHDLYGFHTFWRRPHGDADWRREKKGIVCQSAWQLHTVNDCPFRCSYCGANTVMRVLVNIEEYAAHLDELFQRAPGQRLYKWDNQSDIPCFEPEYDASRVLVERFAREKDRYLEIYVGKSAQTDYLLDYHHGGRTILQWSVAGPSQVEHFEEGTDGMVERFDAAGRLQDAGYIVRFRLSPIIPVRNWRQENRLLLEEMFARTTPDVVTLCPFGWMDVEEAEKCLDFEILDPRFVNAMRSAAPFLRERGYTNGSGHPIPHDTRYSMLSFLIDEIQRIRPDTLIALCLETEEMWQALGPRIGQTPHRYVCNCGPLSTPGDPLYEERVGVASA